jgi:hypothetical protein
MRFTTSPVRAGPGRFPPLQRTQVVALACRRPAELGVPLVRWGVRDLAVKLVEDDVFTSIHYSTVRLILEDADLKPHRTLCWKRSHAPDFDEKAVHVLWCYRTAESLRRRKELVFCLDEKSQIHPSAGPSPTSRCFRAAPSGASTSTSGSGWGTSSSSVIS